ncbi:MAG: glycosyltransferase [Hyphomonadaceae bacterium]|nr:glycosyltransferase [Hyphomonadaceae bacterium]
MHQSSGPAGWSRQAPAADLSAQPGHCPCAVAIPARDEAALIERCLRSLAAQHDAPAFAVVLFLNNCTDDTAEIVARIAPQLPFALQVFSADLPTELADAAWARRLALNAAAGLVRDDGAILSTDADSYADRLWVRSCLDTLDAGADIVCGFVAPDFSDAPAMEFEALRQAAVEYEYSQLACELLELVDPDPDDPWPRHQMETGANLALRARTLRLLGGVPHVCPGEDQALVQLARRNGMRVRHDFRPQVTTSSRTEGRATGGWSDELKARSSEHNQACHQKLEPARIVLRRALMRAGLRRLFPGVGFHNRARRMLETYTEREAIVGARSFSQAWAILESSSPLLRSRPLWRTVLGENHARLSAYVMRWRARADDAASSSQADASIDVST